MWIRLRLFFIFILSFGITGAQGFQFTIQSGHAAYVNKLAFGPSNTLLASAGKDRKCIVWDLKSYKQLQCFILNKEAEFLYFLNSDSVLVIVSKTELVLYHTNTGNKLGSLTIDDQDILYNSFLDNKGRIVLTTNKKYILIHPATCSIISERTFPSDFSSACNAGNKLFISDFSGNYGYLHDWPEPFDPLNPPSQRPSSKVLGKASTHMYFSANPSQGLVYYFSKTKLEAQRLNESVQVKRFNKPFTIFFGSAIQAFSSYAASKDHLLIADRKGVIYKYNSHNGRIKKTLKHHKARVEALAISNDQKYFASCSGKEIVIWDLERSNPIQQLCSNTSEITSINLNASKNSLVIGSADGHLKTWNLVTNEMTEAIVDIPGIMSSFICYVSSVFFINDTLVKTKINYGKRDGNSRLSYATEYEGIWDVKNNRVDLKPLKQYSDMEPGPLLNTDIPGKIMSSDESFTVSYFQRNIGLINHGNHYSISNAHQERITCSVMDEKNKIFYTGSEDGSIKIRNLENGQLIVTLLSFYNDFLYLTPASYYFGSKGAVRNVGYKKGLNIYPFEQFDVIYNRPEKVIEHLPFYSDQQKKLYANAYLKRIKWLGLKEQDLATDFSKAPEIKIVSGYEKVTKFPSYKLVYETWDSVSPIASVDLLINGMHYLHKKVEGKTLMIDSVELLLGPGKNFIQIFSTNSKGLNSVREGFYMEYNGVKERNLYLLSIGCGTFNQSSFNLKYAAKDAKDFAASFRKGRPFSHVFSNTLTEKEASRENIMKELDKLKSAGIEDEVVVFYAGHGLLDSKLNYYLSTYNIDFSDPVHEGLAYDTLIEKLNSVSARAKILFIDACHSGELDKDDVVKTNASPLGNENLVFRSVSGGVISNEHAMGLKNSLEASKILFADLRQNNGVAVISSAGGAEYAIEGEKWNNGVFTYCLLQGLKKKNSDLNFDGKIYLDELQNYLIKEVKRISNGLQAPTSRSENIYNNILIR